MNRKKIAVIVMSVEKLTDFAGPVDVFAMANKHGDIYDITLVSPCTGSTTFSSGCRIEMAGFRELNESIDTLILTGDDSAGSSDDFYEWLENKQVNIRRIGAVNVNAYTVAKLESLNYKRDANQIHYAAGKSFRVDTAINNAFHSRDGKLYTSGGVSSGIDLALAMVSEDCGHGVATDIARKLIFFYLNKQLYRVQFGTLISGSPLAAQLKNWIDGRLHEPLDVCRLADIVNMSQRNFSRVFGKQTGMSPAKFIEKVRVDSACNYLDETDKQLYEVARLCGLGGLVSMRRLFLRHLMITPSEYRRILKLYKNENSN